MSQPIISSTQVASSVPFDNTVSSFKAADVQNALDETRRRIVWNLSTQATTTNGTMTLLESHDSMQIYTGSATGYSVILPVATTLFNGRKFEIVNSSSAPLTVKFADGTTLVTLGQTSIGYVTLQDNSTSNGVWISWQTYIGTAGGILSYNLISSTAFTTSSTTDVLITGFSTTPSAGTYAVFYSASVFGTTSPQNNTWTIYKAGSAVSDSLRTQISSRSNQTMNQSTQSIVQFDGTQTVDVRVSIAAGSLTVNQRSLLLIRLGN
jgi:hypothetical protein